MPTIKALRGFRHHGLSVATGRVLEVSEGEAAAFVSSNRAVVIVPPGNCTRETKKCETLGDQHCETPDCCRAHVVEVVRYMADLLNEAGVTWWADYGTLLGAVRDGRMVPWDNDADFGVMVEHMSDMLLLEDRINTDGFLFSYLRRTGHLFGGGDRVKVYLSSMNRTPVDFFFWHRKPNGDLDRHEYVGCDQFKGREFPEDKLFPLSTVEWEGLTLPAPADPEWFCEHRYGLDWRKPVQGQPTRAPRRGAYMYGRCGLGDSIYMRPLVRAAAAAGPTWVETPWPELFEDIPSVRFAEPKTNLRTQLKNIAGQPTTRYDRVRGLAKYHVIYGWKDLEKGSLLETMERAAPVPADPFVFDLPDFGPCPVKTRKPIALIRPVTERTEWLNKARNPEPEYVAEAAELLMAAGFYVVSVADLKDGHEWIVGDPPRAHKTLHRGELKVRELMALVQHAAVVVGGSGWIIPAAIAAQVPLVVIGGGQAGHNGPDKVTDPRMDLSLVRWVEPDSFCPCADMLHDCDKTITGFGEQFAHALEAVTAVVATVEEVAA